MKFFPSPRHIATSETSDLFAADWKRGCLVPLLLASSLLIGSLAAAGAPPQPSRDQITPQQSAVMEHLRKLYERDGREMPSMRIEDAPLTYLPPGKVVKSVTEIQKTAKTKPTPAATAAQPAHEAPVRTVQGTEDSGGGLFAFFGKKEEKPAPAADSPSLLERMRIRNPFHRSTEEPAKRESFFGRMFSPFRDDKPATAASERPEDIVPPPAQESPSPFSARRVTERNTTRTKNGNTSVRRVPEPYLVPLPEKTASTRPDARTTPQGSQPRSERQHLDSRRYADNSHTRTASNSGNTQLARPADQPVRDRRYITLTRKFAARQGLVGMQGYCPVALREQRRLVDAHDQFLCYYQGRTYNVSSAAAKARFDANPAHYAPAAGGYDVVLDSEGYGEIDGKLVNAVWFQDNLYLFRTSETATKFRAAPSRYVTGNR